jgi:ubiquitin-conjugating enzyme E2 O
MRCLIIGPTGTPYEDAPFLFDIFLPPSKYPSEPPLVHFHSWTNGAGRVNPNLYMVRIASALEQDRG